MDSIHGANGGKSKISSHYVSTPFPSLRQDSNRSSSSDNGIMMGLGDRGPSSYPHHNWNLAKTVTRSVPEEEAEYKVEEVAATGHGERLNS